MPQPLPTVEDLAADAGYAVSDLLSEEEWDTFDALTDVEKIRYQYLHSDCDHLAHVLHRALGWDVRAVSSSRGPLHRLVCAPDGRLLDASGWTSLEILQRRYRCRGLRISEPGRGAETCQSNLDDDDAEEFHAVVAALLHLDCEPFISELRPQIEAFAAQNGLECEPNEESVPRM